MKIYIILSKLNVINVFFFLKNIGQKILGVDEVKESLSIEKSCEILCKIIN